jgi:ribosomal protein L44E
LKSRYGITEHQVVELALLQEGRCAICGAVPDTSKKRGGLHVDHDHASGVVRGLLCELCNLGLGRFKDDPEVLRSALEYLEHPPTSRFTFTKEEPRPSHVVGVRNTKKREVLKLVCKQCGGKFSRKAGDEYASRAKGKEGPFCGQVCSGLWGQSRQQVVGLIHGTTNGYTYHKCRCTECRRAHTQAERDRLKKKRK